MVAGMCFVYMILLGEQLKLFQLSRGPTHRVRCLFQQWHAVAYEKAEHFQLEDPGLLLT